ncbi:primase-helicase family protein [Bradyrhizobium sp. USDA 4350]
MAGSIDLAARRSTCTARQRSTPASGEASPWIDHVRYVFGEDALHITSWLAHRVQFPYQKVNHALVLGGPQGIGKDTMLEPVKAAVGPWNFSEVSPQQMLGRFNGFVKSVVLRVSEARDLGDTDRYGFYEHMKTLTAAPPDVLRVDEKHMREHAVLNVCGVIITTNNKDSMHLPSDDRRHFVAWSSRKKDDFTSDYWSRLYRWFASGGNEIVAHYLAHLDLSRFDAKAPPPKTQAFWEIVDSSRAPEDAEMADALDALCKPAAVTLGAVLVRATPDFSEWLRDRKNRRKIPHRFDECGYVPVRNPDATDGLWKIGNKRQVVYAQRELSRRDQIEAASKIDALPMPPLPDRSV